MASLVTAALTLVTMVRGWWSNVLRTSFNSHETGHHWWQWHWHWWPWWEAGDQMFYELDSFNSHETWHHLWRHCWWPWWDAGDQMYYALDSFNSHETWHHWWWRCWWPWWEVGDKETGAAEDCRLHLASASSPEMPTQPFEHPLFYHRRHAPVIH